MATRFKTTVVSSIVRDKVNQLVNQSQQQQQFEYIQKDWKNITPKLTLTLLLLYLTYGLCVIRLLLYAYLREELYRPELPFLAYDLFIGAAHRLSISLDRVLLLSLVGVPLMGAFANYVVEQSMVKHESKTHLIAHLFDAINRNAAQLEKAIGVVKVRKMCSSSTITVQYFTATYWQLVKSPISMGVNLIEKLIELYSSQAPLGRPLDRLHLYPYLSSTARQRVLFFGMACETSIRTLYFIAAFFLPTLFLVLYNSQARSRKSLAKLLVALVDFGSIAYCAAQCLQAVALLSCFFVTVAVINLAVFQKLDRQLLLLLSNHRGLSTIWQEGAQFERIVRQSLATHAERVRFNLVVNRLIFAPSMVFYFCTNLLCYIYIPVYMTFRPLNGFFRSIGVSVLIGQTAGPLFWMVHILQSNDAMLRSRGLQRMLSFQPRKGLFIESVQSLRLKRAVARYFELLISNAQLPITFKAGIFGNITKRSVMEFLLFYFANMIFFCGTFIKGSSFS